MRTFVIIVMRSIVNTRTIFFTGQKRRREKCNKNDINKYLRFASQRQKIVTPQNVFRQTFRFCEDFEIFTFSHFHIRASGRKFMDFRCDVTRVERSPDFKSEVWSPGLRSSRKHEVRSPDFIRTLWCCSPDSKSSTHLWMSQTFFFFVGQHLFDMLKVSHVIRWTFFLDPNIKHLRMI